MRRRTNVMVGMALAAVFLVAGCATKSDLDGMRSGILQQMAQEQKAQQDKLMVFQERLARIESDHKLAQERTKSLEEKVEPVGKIPADLASDVAAVRRYVRDVEKSITTLRELVARQLDMQNAHITQVKTAYSGVLEQQGSMIETLAKQLESALGELKTTVDTSLKALREALPAADGTIPPAPALPENLRETTEPAPPSP